MTIPTADQRSAERRTRDEQIAAEPHLSPPELPSGAVPVPVETHLGRQRLHPVAIAGIVENGLVRPIDPAVKLPEHSRVIIVAEAK
ncbi:MAG TPA: hypothetical protein VHU84_16450 [Lacipirellulaceae bacterium]|jgi:hypothetical protein|nr:hypothetical protein [Lacipirellulaceae bacterium]